MSLRSQNDDTATTGPWAQSAEWAFRFLFFFVLVVALGWTVSNIRQVPADSQAVVFRFGAFARSQGAGLLIAWPRPIEQIALLPSAARQIAFRIRRFDSNGGSASDTFDIDSNPRQNSGFLLTGDSSVVHLQATLFYQISDPVAYTVAAEHVGPGLERLFIASAISLCAARDLDSILVARPETASQPAESAERERLRADLVNAVNRRLDDLARQQTGFGIHVSRADLTATLPRGAKMAFDRVLTVAQDAEKDIATSRTDAELKSQLTNEQKDRIVADATAKATELVTDAKTHTAPILALGQQGQEPQNGGMSHATLLNRMYYDRVGKVLNLAGRVETVDPKVGVHVILPGDAQQ
jgi:regulator of protease activity HflC (stomatin/prohibitin superfamily)